MCRHYDIDQCLLSRRRPQPASKGERLPALSDCKVDPAPANSQSRLLIAQSMAPLGLHAGDEHDAKESWPRLIATVTPLAQLGTTGDDWGGRKELSNLFSYSFPTFPWVGVGSGLGAHSLALVMRGAQAKKDA
jgi:hypothetical protein